MNPLLIDPTLSAASATGRGLYATGTAALGGAAAATGAAASAGTASFQSHLAAVRGTGSLTPSDLAAMTPAQLKSALASATPQQQIVLAQQLVGSGATVGVADLSGHVTTGKAEKLQIQNGVPVFQVAGRNYSLSSLVSVA